MAARIISLLMLSRVYTLVSYISDHSFLYEKGPRLLRFFSSSRHSIFFFFFLRISNHFLYH
jgi:hypothetical protein